MASTSPHIQCWDGYTYFDNIKRCLRHGHPVLILMRGVPGSGKTTLARQLVTIAPGAIFSADDLFIENGVYKFDPTRLQENHKKVISQAKIALSRGIKLVIIDNTNLYAIHMMPYITQAIRYHYEIYFVEPQTEWRDKPDICALKNIHGVSYDKISSLLGSFERISLEGLIKPVKLKLVPPLADGDFEENLALAGPSGNPFRMNHVSSWSGLLPFGSPNNQVAFSAANFWQLPTSLSLAVACYGSNVSKDNCVKVIGQSEQLLYGHTNNVQYFNPNLSFQRLQTSDKQSKKQDNSLALKSSDKEVACKGPVKEGKVKASKRKEETMVSTAVISKPLFSLLPDSKVQLVAHRSIGIQTNDIIRNLFCKKIMPEETFLETLVVMTEIFMVEKPKKIDSVTFKERSCQTAESPIPTDLEMLLLMFPYEAPADLLHLLQTCGFENTVGIYVEMHAQMDLFANTAEDTFSPDMLLLSETFDVGPSEIFGEISEGTDQSGSRQNLESMAPQRDLPPVSAKQRCSPEPVKDGYCRMDLSLNMIRKLSELFGGDVVDIRKAYVDLPFSFCRQMYEYWQGLPVSKGPGVEGFSCTDFDIAFPSVISPDMSQMVNDCNAGSTIKYVKVESGNTNSNKVSRPKFNTAQKLQLNFLCEEFPSVDRERIEECYCDTNYSLDAVRKTLELFLDQVDAPRTVMSNVFPNSVPFSEASTSNKAYSNLREFEQISKLQEVHSEVGELQEEIDYCVQQRDNLYAKANASKVVAVKQFYVSDAQRYDRRAKALITEKNERISRANSCGTFVDLHHMSVPAAIKLLKEKLKCLDRPPNLRNGRSNRKIAVVTGYGKSSNGPIKLKPAVLQWLNQTNYEYRFSNPGEIIVFAK